MLAIVRGGCKDMNYTELAMEFLKKMQVFHKARPHRNINEAFQGEAFVLHFIFLHGGDVLPGEISNEMDVSSARVAAALNSLENKGLITRQIDKSDRRKILVRLTQEGELLAEKHHQAVVEDAANMLTLLGEHDAKEYVRIISRLAEIIPQRKESKE